jgi:hypothetical protein
MSGAFGSLYRRIAHPRPRLPANVSFAQPFLDLPVPRPGVPAGSGGCSRTACAWQRRPDAAAHPSRPAGNDDRTPMKGVTGGSLPAQIWRRFVIAATPLVDHLKAPATGELTSFSLPMIVKRARCDQAACDAAYSSFRSSDCTYQPYAGPRRLCEKEGPEDDVQPLQHVSTASASRLCDHDRCARRYRSFDPLTCTYQPYAGRSRGMCEEGAQSQ